MDESGSPLPGTNFMVGSQYWANHKHVPKLLSILWNSVRYGWRKEFKSSLKRAVQVEYAPSIVDKVWSTAPKWNRSNFSWIRFRVILLMIMILWIRLPIPMIDIVHYDPVYGYFGDYHLFNQRQSGTVIKNSGNSNASARSGLSITRIK